MVIQTLSAQSPDPNLQWKSDYTQALNVQAENPQKSCAIWTRLSEIKDFPLYKLSGLRALSACEQPTEPNWSQIKKKYPEPWLSGVLVAQRFEYFRTHKHFFSAFKVGKSHQTALKLRDKDLIDLLDKALIHGRKRDRKSILSEIYDLAPRRRPNPTAKQFLKVAKDFRKARHFKKAHWYYDKVLQSSKLSKDDKWKALRGKRKTYKLRRWQKMKEYIESSRVWASFFSKDYKKSKKWTRRHHKAGVEYVRTLWTERGQQAARPVLEKLEKEMEGHHSLQSVFWLKAKMAEESGDTVATLKWLRKSSEEPSLSESNTTRGLWNLAWNLRRVGQFEDSSVQLSKLLKTKDITFYTLTKYKFWLAKNLRDLGRRKDSEIAFGKLLEMDPFGYYGALAYRALNKLMEPIPRVAIDDAELKTLFPNASDPRRFQWLLDTKEFKVAQRFLKTQARVRRRSSSQAWTRYFYLMQKAQNYVGFFIKFHTRLPKVQSDIYKTSAHLLFPLPFLPIVQSVSDKTKVPSPLIYGIMKQESGFDRYARSFADAFGLMQLLPQIAKKVATESKFSRYTKAEDLYDPETSVTLGAQTLRQLLDDFDQQFILAVASYNASKAAVRGWVQTRFHGDPITFIEDIPYEETKGYVKLVLRNYISYSRLLGDQKDTPFPESTLQGLEAFRQKK